MSRMRYSQLLHLVMQHDWLRFVCYPVCIFFLLYFLCFCGLVINPDANIDITFGAAAWMAIQTGVSCALVASLGLAIGRLVKVVHVIIVVLLYYAIAIDLVETFVRSHFHDEVLENGCVWLIVLRNSSWREVFEFILENVGACDWFLFGAYVLSLLATFLLIIRIPVSSPNPRSLVCCFACCVAFVVAFSPPLPYLDCLSQELFSVRQLGLFKEFTDGFTFASLSEIGRNKPNCARYVAECSRDNQPFGVVVFGESATRHHWSLYGYSRRTTPMVEALAEEVVVFSAVRASYWLTIQAMISMLTGKHHLEAAGCCALPSIIRSVGFSCYFFSGQNHWGHWDGADALLFSQCNSKKYLSDSRDSVAHWDHDLIKEMIPAVSDKRVNLCFVHLMGSHFDFAKRYPSSFSAVPDNLEDEIAKAFPSCKNKIASYDNSIAYTDMVLGDMIGEVRRLRPCSFVLYVSDHGESPESSSRDVSQAGVWDVPMIVWTSEEYKRRFPDVLDALEQRKNETMTNVAVFGIVLDLMRIREANANE